MRSFLFKFVLFVIGFIAIERFCHIQTEGFQLGKITSDEGYHAEWDTGPATVSLDPALSQTYTFLGSGGQCYAFVSADKRYVIKFFKQHHMRKLPWLEKMPLPSFLNQCRMKILADRGKRSMDRIFSSYKIAYEELKDETALIYLHLNKTDHFHKTLTIVDKLGIAHKIDLDKTEFALQHYADPSYGHLKKLIKARQIEEAKECLDSLFTLIVTRAQKGIADLDPVIKKNFGFIGNRAVEIDLGSFAWDEFEKRPSVYKKGLFYETQRLKKWLAKRSPELVDYFNAQLYETLSSD